MLSLSGLFMSTRTIIGHKFLHSGAIRFAAEKSPLFKLRQKTGLAYTLCREALNKHDNDVDEAEAWLKAHALAHGIQKASKVRDRSTREGLVCLAVSKDNTMTTFVELNCESDFVARNQVFRDFAIELTEQVVANHQDSTSYKLTSVQDLIEGLKPNKERIDKLQDQIAPFISKLGENIKLTNAFHLHVTNPADTRLFGQIHAQGATKSTDLCDISAGRFGSIVGLQLGDEASREENQLRLMGNRLCQHVIGYNPSYIELPENIRKHLEAVEKEKLENKKADTGEQDETYSDDESSQSSSDTRDDWPSIMDQTLIMTDNLVVRDFCENNKLSIIYFNRFECGIES